MSTPAISAIAAKKLPGLAAHLKELGTRLIYSLAGMFVGLVVAWIFYEQIFQILQEPMLKLSEEGERMVSLNFAGVGTAFSTKLKVSAIVGAIISFPWWIYQISAFIWPGLLRREKRIVVAMGLVAIPLFLTGMALAWYFVPVSIEVLTGFAPDYTATMVNTEVYFDFVLKMLVAFGMAFLVPLVMVGLIVMGLVGARSWLKGWRWAILLSFLFAAVASPSGDIITMTALGAPIVLLYFIAIGVGYIWEIKQLRSIEKLLSD